MNVFFFVNLFKSSTMKFFYFDFVVFKIIVESFVKKTKIVVVFVSFVVRVEISRKKQDFSIFKQIRKNFIDL